MSERYTEKWLDNQYDSTMRPVPHAVYIDSKTGERLTSSEVLDLLNSTVWTRVEDGLPEENVTVRVSISLRRYPCPAETHAKRIGDDWVYPLTTETVEFANWHVTHWQPIRRPK